MRQGKEIQTMDRIDFINAIAPIVQKYAPQYDILCPSAIIAQAILESGWGESRLSKDYHNYFGLKCGTLWKGKAVNMATQEEFEPGVVTNITDNFRAYDSMEEGVKGYFEFIQLPRYQNLKGITYYRTYLQTIKADGYATSSDYVESTCKIVEENNLERYDSNNDAGIVESAVKWMVDLANDDSHGYDQIYRWGEKGDYDCSSAVISAYKQAGVPLTCTYTGNMRKDMVSKGFTDVTNQVNLVTGSGLIRGDVLLNETHHTAMYIGEGMEAEASINERGGATGGQPGDQTGKEILIRSYRNYPWNCVLRYSEKTFAEERNLVKTTTGSLTVPYVKIGDTGAMVTVVQTCLNLIAGTSLKVDGEFGAATDKAVKEYQKANGIKVSGTCGIATFRKLLKDIAKMTYTD